MKLVIGFLLSLSLPLNARAIESSSSDPDLARALSNLNQRATTYARDQVVLATALGTTLPMSMTAYYYFIKSMRENFQSGFRGPYENIYRSARWITPATVGFVVAMAWYASRHTSADLNYRERYAQLMRREEHQALLDLRDFFRRPIDEQHQLATGLPEFRRYLIELDEWARGLQTTAPPRR